MTGLGTILKPLALGECPTGSAWFDAVRHEAVLRYGAVELPDAKTEEYRRFDLKKSLANVTAFAEEDCTDFEPLTLDADVVIECHNGRVVDARYSLLAESERVGEFASELCEVVDVLSAMFASDGVVVRVPKGERQRVVIDSRWSGGEGTLAAGRVVVVVGEGAEVELTEVCRTRGEVVVLRGREIVAERGAVVRVADITENPRGVVVESRITTQREGSSCRALFCNLSEGACRTNIKNILAEAHAESECNGVFVTSEQTHDIMMDVRHEASDCRSSELIKGMAMGTSVGSFAGCIYVAEGAQKTDASLLNRNIVLGEGARIYTKPTLEIYADDVKCGHGATVGKLDPEAIYYMRQRGLSEQMARQLQLMGFAAEVVESYGGAAAERMTAAIERILQTI